MGYFFPELVLANKDPLLVELPLFTEVVAFLEELLSSLEVSSTDEFSDEISEDVSIVFMDDEGFDDSSAPQAVRPKTVIKESKIEIAFFIKHLLKIILIIKQAAA